VKPRALVVPLHIGGLSRKRVLWFLVLLAAAGLTVALVVRHSTRGPAPLLQLSAPSGDGLVSNSYAAWHPTEVSGARLKGGVVTSGSPFARDGVLWSGKPDAIKPNVGSTDGTGSATFRIYSQATFGDVELRFDLENLGFTTTPSTPARQWDRIHVFLRARNEYSLYVVSVNRRDATVGIKRKTAGGPSNGGTYSFVAPNEPYHVPLGLWQHFKITAVTNRDSTVTIRLYLNDRPIAAATDTGSTGPILANPGRVGLRSDNDEFAIRNLAVYPAPRL
jgi:3-keto-disaccharide hydrolase